MSAHDFRFQVIEQSVDCRKADEKNPHSECYIPKSRYSAVSHYISQHDFVSESDNDTHRMPIDPKFKVLLQDIGIDDRLGYHLAALFTRSPVPAYEQELNFGPGCNPKKNSITGIDELKGSSQGYWNSEERKRESDSDFEDLLVREAVTTGWWTKIPPIDGHSHFENLQSTNWNSLRFKPPPTLDTTDIGWRVEFRPMDI